MRLYHFDGLVQERRNSSALAMELRLSCTSPSICNIRPISNHLVIFIPNLMTVNIDIQRFFHVFTVLFSELSCQAKRISCESQCPNNRRLGGIVHHMRLISTQICVVRVFPAWTEVPEYWPRIDNTVVSISVVRHSTWIWCALVNINKCYGTPCCRFFCFY